MKNSFEMINIINHIIEYKNIYLIVNSIIITAIICRICKVKFNKIVEFVFHISITILLGLLIKNLSNDTLLAFFLANKGIVIIIFMFFLIIFIKELFSYSKTKKIVTDNLFRAVYIFMLILMAIFIATKVNALLNLYQGMALFFVWAFLNSEKKGQNNTLGNNEISDNPINSYDSLFPTRKKECTRIYNYIKNLDTDDPFAIAINAEWGEGKTSFINALQEKMENDQNSKNNIIFIQPMILDTREKLLRYVFEQLESILVKNKIYTGKGSPYKKYFDLLLKFINNKSINKLADFFEIFPKENSPDLREYKLELEKNIEYLIAEKQRIYIIVDDLDRVEEETVRGTLTFIKEIVNLKGITVLFLVDYKKIISDDITIEYLEKFINTKFDLRKINYKEIFSHYIETLLPNYFLQETREEVKILQEQYDIYLIKIGNNIKDTIKSLSNKIEKINTNEQAEHQEDKEDIKGNEYKSENLLDQYLDYDNKIRNARYVKKIISGVKESLKFFEESLKKESEALVIESRNINVNELIFKLNIFKVIFKEEYDELIKTGDINAYISNCNNELVKSFFQEIEKKIYVSENEIMLNNMRCEFYNSLIFSEEISKEIYLEIKTEIQKIIEEIDLMTMDQEALNFEKLTKYIRAINFTSGSVSQEVNIKRIGKFTKLTISLLEKKKIKLINIFELLGDTDLNILIEFPLFYKEVDKFLYKHPDIEFESNKEKQTSLHYLYSLELPLILKNFNNIIMMIFIYYFDNVNYTYSSIRNSFENINNLKDLNKVLIDMLILDENKSMSQLDENKLKSQLHENKTKSQIYLFAKIIKYICKEVQNNHKNNNLIIRSLKYNKESLNEFIKILRLKALIVKKVTNISLNDEVLFGAMGKLQSWDELVTHINKVADFIKSNPTKINKSIFRFFHSILNEVYNNNYGKLDKTIFLKIKEVFMILDNFLEINTSEYDINSWIYCSIIFAKLEKEQKRLINK